MTFKFSRYRAVVGLLLTPLAVSACEKIEITITSPANGERVRATGVRISWDTVATPNATFTCQLDNAATEPCWPIYCSLKPESPNEANCNFAYSNLLEGPHRVTVRVSDPSGRTGAASVDFVIDTVFPIVEITAPTGGQRFVSSDVSVAFSSSSGTGPIGTQCQLDSGLPAPCTSPHAYSGLSGGPHTVKVIAIDASGDSGSKAISFVVENGSMPELRAVQQISASPMRTCALFLTGNVRCWGLSVFGQGTTPMTIGDDEFPASSNDVNVGGRVVQVAVGGESTCALLDTRKV
ncbi:MAG TPA: RCC1 domain-containing protein, partial [Polyangiaceae bacterium]|nr:RCC1 domain-containing protein [Polyangiaceae bacterium]